MLQVSCPFCLISTWRLIHTLLAMAAVLALATFARAQAPPNDNFTDAIVLSGEAGSIEGINLNGSREPGEPAHLGFNFGASVWYRYTPSSDGSLRVDTCVSATFDTVLAVYTGSSVSALSLVALNDDSCGLSSRVEFPVAAGTEYHIAVDGYSGAQGAFILSWLASGATGEDVQTVAPLQEISAGDGSYAVKMIQGGKLGISGGKRGAILWDADTGDILRRFSGHTNRVTDIEVLPGEQQFLTSSYDGTVRVWDIVTGETLHILAGNDSQVQELAISDDARYAVFGTFGGWVFVYSTDTWEQLAAEPIHSSRIYGLDICGDRVYTASFDAWIRASLLPDLAPDPSFSPVYSQIAPWYSLHCNSDAGLIIAGAVETLNLFDMSGAYRDSYNVFPASGNIQSIYDVAYLANANLVVCATYTGELFTVNPSSGASSRFQAATETIRKFHLYDDGKPLLATASWDDHIRIFDILAEQEVADLWLYSGSIHQLHSHPSGERIYSVGYDKYIKSWDTATGDMIAHGSEPHLDRAYDMAMTANPTVIATVGLEIHHESLAISPGSEGLVRLWNPDTLEYLGGIPAYQPRAIAWNPVNGKLMVGTFSSLYEADPTPDSQAVQIRNGPVSSLASSSAGVFLGEEFGGTYLYTNAAGGFEQIPGATTPEYLAASPDGTGLIVVRAGGLVEHRRADSWSISRPLPFPGQARAAAVSPDGSRAAVIGSGGTLGVFDLDLLEMTHDLRGFDFVGYSVAFSPDGTRVYAGGLDGAILSFELNPPRAIVVAGSGPYPGNPIAQQTRDLAAYTFRTLKARGYSSEDILLLSAFDDDLDADNDGISDVDGIMSLGALEEAIKGEFGSGASRLLIVLLGHGHRTGSFMTYRATQNELLPTTVLTNWLDELQAQSLVDVTVLADFCYSGQLALDAALAPVGGAATSPRRTIIASTSPTAEAVFLPPPDMTSFTHTFLSSAYMGSSFGESFRAGQRFFSSFPVANQVPTMDVPSLQSLHPDRQFLGTSWTYGVQSTRDMQQTFPVFAEVNPDTTINPGQALTLTAQLNFGQTVEGVVVVIRPPSPVVQSGEPVTGLPRVDLQQDPLDPLRWTGLADGNLFLESGPYVISFTARLGTGRVSNPHFANVTVSEGLDPDATPIRGIVATAATSDPELDNTLLRLGSWSFSVVLERFKTQQGEAIPGAVQWVSSRLPVYARKDGPLREREQRALATVEEQVRRQGPTSDDLVRAIDEQDAETGRLYIHIVSDDARQGQLRLGSTRIISAAELDSALDNFQSRPTQPEVVLIIDAPGSGSFFEPLLPTGGQKRLIITSGRAGDGAVFLSPPLLTSFSHRFLTRAWQGSDLLESFQGARNFFEDFLAYYPDIGRITPLINDTTLARTQWLGRRWAFGAESELPFILAIAPDDSVEAGAEATLWLDLIEGVEPVSVFAQIVPPGLDLGDEPLTELHRVFLTREGEGWRWRGGERLSAPGIYRVAYWAEYSDSDATRLTQPGFGRLVVLQVIPEDFDATGWMFR